MTLTMKFFYSFLAIAGVSGIVVSFYYGWQEWKKNNLKPKCRNCQHCCGIHDDFVFCMRHSTQRQSDGYCQDYKVLE